MSLTRSKKRSMRCSSRVPLPHFSHTQIRPNIATTIPKTRAVTRIASTVVDIGTSSRTQPPPPSCVPEFYPAAARPSIPMSALQAEGRHGRVRVPTGTAAGDVEEVGPVRGAGVERADRGAVGSRREGEVKGELDDRDDETHDERNAEEAEALA